MPVFCFAETGMNCVLGREPLVRELLLHPIDVRVGLVNLVHRDDDRHAGRFGVIHRFNRLRHDTVVRRDHENRDIRDLCAARAHLGERFVSGRIDERHLAVAVFDRVRADALRDAAGFSSGDFGGADRVQQRGLAVVDVAQHGHDGRTRGERADRIAVDDDLGDLFAGFFDDRVEPKAASHLRTHVGWDVLVDRRHRAHLDELGDDLTGGDLHRGGELLHRDEVRDLQIFEHRRLGGRCRCCGLVPLLTFVEQLLALSLFAVALLVLARALARSRGCRP